MLCPRCHRRYEDDHLFCPHDGEKLVDGVDIRRLRPQPSGEFGKVVADRYQIRGTIGRGATAEVFLAHDRTTDSPVALKVLDSRQAREPKVRARFILEAQAAALISHPSIVKVLDVGLIEDGAPYIAMEFLFGEPLSTYLVRSKRMAPSVGLPLVRQIAVGLSAAHRAGIVHRDIKPGNIFLLGEKGTPYGAKILDFGFAKLNELAGLTATGTTVGTLQYMAPEQAVSDPAEPRTDVYGLGILMYRLFAGRLPFVGRDEAEVLAMQLAAAPPALDLGTDATEKGLAAVIMKAMRKHPDNRYASMDALLEDLGRLSSPASLAANMPLARADVYEPQSSYSQNIGEILKSKLG